MQVAGKSAVTRRKATSCKRRCTHEDIEQILAEADDLLQEIDPE